MTVIPVPGHGAEDVVVDAEGWVCTGTEDGAVFRVRPDGARIDRVLADAPGAEVAPGLFECELKYLHDHEWARSADDVLWRRSKLGLHFSAEERAAVAAWCTAHWAGTTATSSPETAWN